MAEEIPDHSLISGRFFFPLPAAFSDPFRVDCGDAKLGAIRLFSKASPRNQIAGPCAL